MKLSDYVIQFVADLGVRHVFMLPGGGAMHLNDSLAKKKSLKFICNLHEQASAIAADAYSQFTNNLGVALVTTGPGGTNTITGVAGSWLDSIPVLYLSGQVKNPDRIGNRKVRQMGFQEIDIVKMVSPITKYAVTVTDPATIRYHLEKAVHLAKSGRPGPVWIDIPLDVQVAEIQPEKLKKFVLEKAKATFSKKDLAKVAKLLNEAERPVILAGNGIRLADAEQTFQQVEKFLKIPVLATWKAIDLCPEDDPYYVGRPGAIAQRGANFAQQNSDLILILGARLDFGQTAYNHKNFAPFAKKIMVDVDKYEYKKLSTKVHVPVECDLKVFLSELLKNKKRFQKKDRSAWLKTCKGWQKRFPVLTPDHHDDRRGISDYVFLDILSEQMKPTDLLVPGSSGACSERTMQAFRVKSGIRVLNSQGLGAMGFGIPMALGACLASGRRTVCIDGDGGFVMNIQELEVIRRLKLPIKFFILNNDGYGSIRNTQINYFQKRFIASSPKSGLTIPDYKKVAACFEIPYFRAKTHAELKQKIASTLATPGPVICELFVSAEQLTAPRVMSKKLPNGQMVSAPMEDLWPFLAREELAEIMSVSSKR